MNCRPRLGGFFQNRISLIGILTQDIVYVSLSAQTLKLDGDIGTTWVILAIRGLIESELLTVSFELCSHINCLNYSCWL